MSFFDLMCPKLLFVNKKSYFEISSDTYYSSDGKIPAHCILGIMSDNFLLSLKTHYNCRLL